MALRRFITLEGGEGSGKTTQVKRLAARIEAYGHNAIATREPGGAPFAEAIREALLKPAARAPDHLAQALAFNAARADHLEQTIRPALERGDFVICDRFTDSTRVYQCFAGDLPPETAEILDAIVVGQTQPTLTLLLDLPPSVGLARARARLQQTTETGAASQSDMYESRSLAFHERVRDGFLAIAKAHPDRCCVIDGTLSVDEIGERVWNEVATRFGL